jgi:hypothetical protein
VLSDAWGTRNSGYAATLFLQNVLLLPTTAYELWTGPRAVFGSLAELLDAGGRLDPHSRKEIPVIELERREAARFRAAVRRCVAGRPRGLAPPIVLQQTKDGLTLSAVLEETAISLCLPGAAGPTERLVVPFSTLAALDGAGGGIATFEAVDGGAVRCRLTERGESKNIDCESVAADQQPPVLPSVGKLHPVHAAILPALHACGQTVNRDTDTRFALARLQLRGQAGEIAGTDGRQLLLWGGFELPFRENLLVPAMPIFGSRDLTREEDVRIGRTTKHVVLAAGPWTFWLSVDAASRFPDVTTVLPRSSRMAKLVLDEAEATALLRDLQEAPASGDDVVPVALEFGLRPAVRWRAGTPGSSGTINLIRSICTGPATAITIDPKFFVRALSLGFREVRSSSAEAPILFRDQHRSYLVANLGPAPASADRPALPAPQPLQPLPPNGDEPMNSERNGGPPTDHSPADDVLDPLTEAEALRAALAEVARRVTRLIASLRQFQKQRRALHAAWSSLRPFGLGTKEEP